MEDVTKIYSQFKQVGQQLEVIRSLYGKAKELDELTGENAIFTEEAYKLLDTVKEFVTLVEESDTNLDPETTKLEGVDKFFEGHEATKYVNDAINEVYNGISVNREYGENEIHDHLFEGLCWCQFKLKLKRMNLTVDTAPISSACLSGIEATQDAEGNCFICEARKQNKKAVDEFNRGMQVKPCCDECTGPCPCDGKDEVKSAILRATDPVEPFVRPNPTCKLVCTINHCSCEDGW